MVSLTISQFTLSKKFKKIYRQLNQNEECESVNNMNELERPSDFPELEQPPIPGTSHHWSRPQPTPFITNINIASTSNSSTMTGGSGPKKKFVSKITNLPSST